MRLVALDPVDRLFLSFFFFPLMLLLQILANPRASSFRLVVVVVFGLHQFVLTNSSLIALAHYANCSNPMTCSLFTDSHFRFLFRSSPSLSLLLFLTHSLHIIHQVSFHMCKCVDAVNVRRPIHVWRQILSLNL